MLYVRVTAYLMMRSLNFFWILLYGKIFNGVNGNNEDIEDRDFYSDKNVNPETYEGRMLKPKTMDCIMNTKKFENFKKNLKNKGIFYDTNKNHNIEDKTELNWQSIEKSIKSIQFLSISLCNKNIKKEMLHFLKKNVSNNIFKNAFYNCTPHNNNIELSGIKPKNNILRLKILFLVL